MHSTARNQARPSASPNCGETLRPARVMAGPAALPNHGETLRRLAQPRQDLRHAKIAKAEAEKTIAGGNVGSASLSITTTVGSGGLGDGDIEGRRKRVSGAAALETLEFVEGAAELPIETSLVA